MKLALKRGFFIEFDAKQFFDCSVFHQGPYLDAMIVDNDRSLVAEILPGRGLRDSVAS